MIACKDERIAEITVLGIYSEVWFNIGVDA